MTAGAVHVGDVGTTYRAVIQDTTGTFNPSSASESVFLFQTPDGLLERPATVEFVEVGGGSGAARVWVMSYTLVSPGDDAFHAAAGVYGWQGKLRFPGGQCYHTNIETYHVLRNLD